MTSEPNNGERLPEEPVSSTTVAFRPVVPKVRPGRYVPRQFHDRGGMGEVWLAEDCDIGREVAIKALRSERAEQWERFLGEGQITGQLEHPNIVPVYDLGLNEEGRPFYVMKFVRGRTLKEAIDDFHAPTPDPSLPREVQRLRLLESFVALCQAMAYAHSRGVIHRDLKPANVMLGPYGETLVIDWGLAKVVGHPEPPGGPGYVHLTYSGGSAETAAGSVIGTPAYMPPEMAEGRVAQVDERCDVYLLGATLYHILTGQPPRQGRSHEEMVELARTVAPVPPRQLKPDVPRALEAICLKAMAQRQKDRYAGALDLAADVQRYLAGEPVSAYPEPVLDRAWRWCKRHRRALARSAAAALLVGVALLGFAVVREARQREQTARFEAALLKQQEEARREVEEFRQLAGKMHFYAASTNPAGEHAPYFEPRRGEETGVAALAVAQKWGPGLEQLPLAEERESLRQELSSVLLLLVQLRSAQARNPSDAPALLALLDQAAALREPSRAYHHLRAACYRLQGDAGRAAEEQQRADAPGTAATALDHFLQGERLRTRTAPAGDVPPDAALDRAIEEYRQALRIDPDHYWSHFQLGRCYLGLGRHAEAVEALGACVALRPDAPWGYSTRGLALGLLKRFPEAEHDLERALAKDPDFRPARLNRGVVLWLQKGEKEDAALEDFTAVLEPPEEKKLVEAAYYRGLVHLQRAHPQKGLDRAACQKAVEDFGLVVSARPGFRPAYLARAQAHLLLGNHPSALKDLDAFLDDRPRFDPAAPEAYEQRGRLLRRLIPKLDLPQAAHRQKLGLALEQLRKADELGVQSAALFDDLGAVLESLGKVQEAIEAYSRGVKLAPDDAKLRTKRGWAYVLRGEHDKAREDFAVAARQEPGSAAERLTRAEAHTGLGYVEACRKAPREAQREATRAVLALKGVDHYVIRHNLACIYGELSRHEQEQAIRTAHQDLALDFLRAALALARPSGAEAREIQNIHKEPAFPRDMKERPEFQELLRDGGR
jgi:serine/threonine protein kinase